ncbi:MAG: RsmE family RNA methyltransferase, partial [Patescibacteria group bacterium]
MRLHRFYIEEKLAGKSEVKIFDEALLHQLKDVFRLQKGDSVIFFDGEGSDVTYRIEMISKKEGAFAKESESKSIMPESKIALYMALIKKDNFELVLQKCTELGVSKFVPIMAERSEKKNIDMDRAKRIIKEASEQCGRGDLPELSEIKSLEEILNENDHDELYLLYM